MRPDDDVPDDSELDAWIAVEHEADGAAAQLLRDALSDARGAPAPAELAAAAERARGGMSRGAYPFDWISAAAGFGYAAPLEHT